MDSKRYWHAIRALLILFFVCVFAFTVFFLVSSYEPHTASAINSATSAEWRPVAVRKPHTPSDLLLKSAITSSYPTPEPTTNSSLHDEELYQSYVDAIVKSYFPNMDGAMVKALIYTESRYQPNVASPAGAVGLMQVIPKYHAWRMEKYGLHDIWDPYSNIVVGMDLLNELYLQYGNWYDVLYFYSGGDSYYPELIKERSALYR